MERAIRLSLGSGGKFTPSYRNTDLFPGTNVSEVFDQSSVPYRDSCIHAIYSEHALEHCAGHEAAESTVSEWARVLRSGGHLVLKVPDLELCCENFLRSEDVGARNGERWSAKDWYKYTIYGIQKTQGSEPPEGQYHRTGFTKPGLRRLMEKNGFQINRMFNYDGWGTPSIVAEAVLNKTPRVYWLVPGKIDENHGSLRIRCLNVNKWLRTHGVDSNIIEYGKEDDVFSVARTADVVVMFGFGKKEFELIQRLRRSGIAVVQEHCEDIEGLPFQDECFGAVNLISCCSTVLSGKSFRHGRSICTFDAFEESQTKSARTYEPHGWNGRLRVVWCGMGGNAQNAESIRHIIESLGMELRIISEWDSLCSPPNLKWNKDTWLDDLADADIVVSPQRHWLQPAKSNNKVTQAMALGMPVLCSPIVAYQEAIRHGENGFISSTPEEWKRDLEACKDQSVRERVGRAAKVDVYKNYSIDVVGGRWKELISFLAKENCNPPCVDIIIPTWNNLRVLKKCIQSIRYVTDWPYNIIVVNSGTDGTKDWLAQQPDVIAINVAERLHFSHAINAGISVGKAEYVCLLNDDTIVSVNWINGMMYEAMKPGVGAVNPFSNCDKGWLHDESMSVGGVELVPGMSFDAVEPIITKLYTLSHGKVVTQRSWVAFFATVIPRAVIDKVGKLDEGFKSGCEDSDYCLRIAKAGYRMLTTYDSVVFHLGGTTRKMAENIDFALHHKEDEQNKALLAAKHSLRPRKNSVVIYTGPAWERWSPSSVNSGGIGGSETCVVYVAKEFANRGFETHVFGDCKGLEGMYDGVKYCDYNELPAFVAANEIGVFISSRRPDIFALPIRAEHKICWVHDIWVNNDPNANIFADKIDRFFCLSPWHKDFFCNHHKSVHRDKVYVTRDAVDLERFNHSIPREKGRMIYTSSPDRGLDVLLDCLPRIRAKVPEANLHVFYGFKNWEESLKERGNKHEIEWMENLKKKLNEPGVVFHGRIGQDELAKEFLKSELWAYPTFFTETYCISAVEAMAAGLPAVTTNLAALSTTVGDAGVLMTGDPRSESYQDVFVNNCVLILTNESLWREFSRRSLEKASGCSWSGVVDEWISYLDMKQ
jgi:glycosyltransferase involved in cell wall biosynthesis